VREDIYRLEDTYLSPYAVKSEDTKGRERDIEPCPLRTDFQRDRDRIIHSKSFRRLKHKTQAFIAPEGDHFRTRLTHTVEVSQIARTIARALFLNEDLTEAIAMGHDIGHTPFGHTGERALASLTGGKFSHNKQSLRVVETLENDGYGLNLTFEVRDGILNHRLSCKPATAEGYVVMLADKIAYVNHDIDDAVEAGMITASELPARACELLGGTKRDRINSLVYDAAANSKDGCVRLSSDGQSALSELRAFMFERVYMPNARSSEELLAEEIVRELFVKFTSDPKAMPEQYANLSDEYGTETAVCDYIAGMTDGYAMKISGKYIIPKF
jgi:dGTPase